MRRSTPNVFRVRLAGRIDQVWIPAVHDKPLYQAELIVAKSKPLQWASPLALIGMPIVEPPGEDFDDEQEDSQNAETIMPDGDQQQSVLGKNPMTESLEVRFPSRPPFSVGERVTLIGMGSVWFLVYWRGACCGALGLFQRTRIRP